MAADRQICLIRRVTRNHKGHYEIVGRYGQASVVVELDREIVSNLSDEDKISAILTEVGRIQRAARRSHRAGRFALVHYPWSDRLKHHLIALTPEDLIEA